MKILRWIAWISAAIAAVLIIMACIALVIGKLFCGVAHGVNFFHAANSFLLVAITLFIVTKNCCCSCKDEKKEG
jgi:hypothetical protein